MWRILKTCVIGGTAFFGLSLGFAFFDNRHSSLVSHIGQEETLSSEMEQTQERAISMFFMKTSGNPSLSQCFHALYPSDDIKSRTGEA
jgi:hypothetical protein